MKTISRYIMTLALLMTAASGAWAQEVEQSESFTTNTGATVYTGEHFKITVDDKGDGEGFTLSQTKNATIEALNGETITKVELTRGWYNINAFSCEVGTTNISGTVATVSGVNQTSLTVSATDYLQIIAVKVYFVTAPAEPDVEVTTNAASEGATFTEASFNMPAYDATAEYELVRDITQKVDVEVRIDGAATERVRIAKDGDGHYKFVTKQENGWQFAAVDKLDNNKDLTNGELTYTFKMKEGNDYVAKNFDTDLCPGTWRLEATANAEKPYEGIAYSKDIVLYKGYEITVAAGEYATFYKDEALYTEDADAELYTIASVTDTEVVLSDQIKVAPAKTPLLIYNKGEKDMTFILLPTEEQADAITAADQFKGTLVDKDMPASTEGDDYYVCTGKAFVWVMSEGTIAANKCWLEIIAQSAGTRANTRSITGGSNTTGIDAATRDDIDGNYYDLQGRKVVKPNRKGIYIKNGKKVIKH